MSWLKYELNVKTRIRLLYQSDVSALAELANNKKIWDNLRDFIPHPYTERDADDFINLTKQENPKQTFGIEYNGSLCGVIGLAIQDDIYRKSAELGYWIGEAFWGNGIATKAVELVSDYGFENISLNRIYAGVFAHNTASMQVLEKNGFEREGVFKKAVMKNDQIMDEHRFYKLNDHYK